MALTEDLNLFLGDFGVSCTAGAVSALGILDMPGQVISDGMVLTTDYTLTARTADFGGLLYGDGITVDGVNYQVRETRKLDDGKFVEISLMKLAPDATAPGGQPREFSLQDLADVNLTDPLSGEVLINDGSAWVDGSAPKSITIAEPQPGDQFTLLFTRYATTISQVLAVVRGTTPSVTYELRYAPERDEVGTLAIVPATVTSTSAGDAATIQNMPIPADRYLWLEVTAVSGTVSELNVSIEL
jgi:hypothetical protein